MTDPGRPGRVDGDPPVDDPVTPDPDASYERASAAPYAGVRERAIVSAQLGRPARGRSAVVHRCAYGLPTAIRVDPLLPDGTPFPTMYWQTCPALRSQIGRLEADQSMVDLNQRLDTDPDFQGEYAAAMERYRDARNAQTDDPVLPGNPYAGGNPKYVKCLHVHAGHHLATGDNVIGAWTVEASRPVPCTGPCVSDDDGEAWTEELRKAGLADED